ncbi:MAG TPA: shikimate kinase [Bacteroidales bacterium]|nr:shikimate kinase [Bacteroidales bacterium]HPS62469.1 shikimate kinase [Bacteroidales bacterium]
MRIYLIGYMASGKSNLGSQLAERLGFQFVDLDDLFEERYRISVGDFFKKYDEPAFRRIERSLLLETTTLDRIVIATGGGTPCHFDNMDVIRRAGLSVYLRWDVSILALRLVLVKRKRPLLKDVDPAALEARIKRDLQVREPIYLQADLVAEGDTLSLPSLYEMIREQINLRDPAG